MSILLIVIICMSLITSILLMMLWKNRPRVEIQLSEVGVAQNGTIVDAEIQIKNAGRMPARLSQITLHLIEHWDTHVLEADSVFGGTLPCEIEPEGTLDLSAEFSVDRPLLAEAESEAWIVCQIGKRDLNSNRLCFEL